MGNPANNVDGKSIHSKFIATKKSNVTGSQSTQVCWETKLRLPGCYNEPNRKNLSLDLFSKFKEFCLRHLLFETDILDYMMSHNVQNTIKATKLRKLCNVEYKYTKMQLCLK